MDLPSVLSLCLLLGNDLHPAPGFEAPSLPISAVHVSELTDPTAYLTGGELLLTTCLTLPDSELGVNAYVARLVDAGVSALGVGLGPAVAMIPEGLASACQSHGLCLLVVPTQTAFLTVTKAYWTTRSRSTQQSLSDALTAHRALVNAMIEIDPVGAMLRTLSAALGAWVAVLDVSRHVAQVFPSGRASQALTVADRFAVMGGGGIHSVTSFTESDHIVAIFPLPLQERLVGHLVIGADQQLTPVQRRLVMTATALLSLDAVQRQRADASKQAQLLSVSTLLDLNEIDAAHRLNARLGLRPLDPSMKVLVVRTTHTGHASDAIRNWTRHAFPGIPEGEVCWFVVPTTHPPLTRLNEHLLSTSANLSAIMSEATPLTGLHQVRMGMVKRALELPPGTLVAANPPLTEPEWKEGLQRVISYRRTELTPVLVAYLRNRGQWNAAAKDLGVHRNTMRHSVARIRDLLQVDLDDPDVSSGIWLYLRETGRA